MSLTCVSNTSKVVKRPAFVLFVTFFKEKEMSIENIV